MKKEELIALKYISEEIMKDNWKFISKIITDQIKNECELDETTLDFIIETCNIALISSMNSIFYSMYVDYDATKQNIKNILKEQDIIDKFNEKINKYEKRI